MACHDPSCAPPPAGTGGSRKITALRALAAHSNTPPHEAASALRRVKVLVKRYGDPARIKPTQSTLDWLKEHSDKAKAGPKPGTKAFNDLVTSKLAKSRESIDTLRPKPRKAIG